MRNKHSKKIRPRHRRALSNVVTSAILLAAVSIMGVMMLGWSQTSIAEQKIELNELYDTQMNKIGEDLIYENIWFAVASPPSMTANHLNVTVTNIGILGLNVTSIRITNVTGTNSTAFTYSFTDGGITKSSSLSLNVTYPWDINDELDVLVFTNRGNQFITQVVVP